MKRFEITDENFNKLTTEELKRMALSDDNGVWIWNDILDELGEETESKSNKEILDLFYEILYDDDIVSKCCSNLIYFDGEMKNLCFI